MAFLIIFAVQLIKAYKTETMKKILFAFCSLFILSATFSKATLAQDNLNLPGFHDLSMSAGYGSSMQYLSNYTKVISGYPSYESTDFRFAPTITAEYAYRLNKTFAVGAFVSIQTAKSVIMNEGFSNTKASDYWYSLLPQVRCYWYSDRRKNVYSKAAVGLSARRNKYVNTDNIVERFKHFDVAWHVSAIGFEYGETVCGFAEAGFGTQGFVVAGVRIKFSL